MSLMEMSFSGAVLILVILAVRAALKGRLPKRTFVALWMVALIRLLIPFSIPSAWSAYTFSANVASRLENMIPGLRNAASGLENMIPGLRNAVSGLENIIPGLRNAVSGSENLNQDEAAEQAGNFADTASRQDLQSEQNLQSRQSEQTVQGLQTEQSQQTEQSLQIRQNLRSGQSQQTEQGLQSRQSLNSRQNAESSAISTDTSEEMLSVTEQPFMRPYAGKNLWKMIWAAGAFLCLTFFAWVYWRCCREFRMSLPVETEILGNWYEEHPLRRKLSVRQSDQIASPVSYGIRRPVILLSKSVLSRSVVCGDRFRLRYVLEHEYVHIQYFDAAVKLLMVMALCVHWFNPFVYLMYIFLNRDLELACDETVVRRFGEEQRSAYAMALIEMEEEKSGLLLLGNSFSKNAIEERIRAIMKIKKMSLPAHGMSVVLVCGVALFFATSCGTSREAENLKEITQEESLSSETQEMSATQENPVLKELSLTQEISTYNDSAENDSEKEIEDRMDAIDQAIQAQEDALKQIVKLNQEIQTIEEEKDQLVDQKMQKSEEGKKKYAVLEQRMQEKEKELRQWTDNLQDITQKMENLQEQRESMRLVQEEMNRDEFFDQYYGKYGIHYELSENTLYKDDIPVRFFIDEKKGGVLWASNEGNILVEAVYDDKGNIKELAVEEDASQKAVEAALKMVAQAEMTWEEAETAEKVQEAAEAALKQSGSAARSLSRSDIFSTYQKFGLSYDEKKDCLMYENKAVGYFKDETSPGMYIRFVEETGDLGVVVKRNNHGEIICLRTVSFDPDLIPDAETTEAGEAVLSQESSAGEAVTREAEGSSAKAVTAQETGASAAESAAAQGTYDSYKLEDWESKLRKEYKEHGMTLADRKTDRWTYNGKDVAVIYDKRHWIYTNGAVSDKNSVCLEVVRDYKDQIKELKEVTREEIQKMLEES